MRAERVRQITAQAQNSAKRIEDARGAFAARPGFRPGSSSATAALKRQARSLVISRNEGETVLADVGEAREELQGDLQRSRQESAEAQQAVTTAEQDEDNDGLGAVGGHSSAGNNARARAQRSQAAAQAAQDQVAELQEGSASLEQEVRAASDTGTLLSGFEGNERDAAATALENAEKSEGPPRRKASVGKILAGGLLGGGIGLGIGGLIGGGIGALAGTFLGSTALGAAVGAGAGALLGGLVGSIAGGAIAARQGRKLLPGRGGGSPHDEGTYDNVDAATDRGLAPERLRALNAAAPAPVAMGASGSFLDGRESASVEARAAGASIAAGAVPGRGGVVPSFRGSLPSVNEVDDHFYAGVADAPGMTSQPHSRSASPVPSLSSIGQDDEAEAAAERQDAVDREAAAQEHQRQAALLAQRQMRGMEEEGGTVGGGSGMSSRASLAAQADSGPQMSEEERAVFEAGLALKDSGRDAASVQGRPATAMALFGTDQLNAQQSFDLKKRQLEAAGQGEIARTLAGPPTAKGSVGGASKARRGRKARTRDITDEMLDAPSDEVEPAPVATPLPQPADTDGGGLKDAHQGYSAQAESPSVRQSSTTKSGGGLLSGIGKFIGESLLGAGLLQEHNGWTLHQDQPNVGPPASRATASTGTADTGAVPEHHLTSSRPAVTPASAEDLAFRDREAAKGPRQPSLEDWVTHDDSTVSGSRTDAPSPSASPTPSPASTSSSASWFSNVLGRLGATASPTPAVTPRVTPSVTPATAALGGVSGDDAAAMGRQRGADVTAQTEARLASERTMLGGAWAWLSSGGLNQRERMAERREEIRRKYGSRSA